MTLVPTFFRMPWFIYPLIAAAVVWFGTWTAPGVEERAAQITAVMQDQPPVAVPLDQYQHENRKFYEGSFRAQIVSAENTRIVERRNGLKTGEKIMVVLADPGAKAGLKEFRGVMVLSTSEFAGLTDWAETRFVGLGELGPILEFSGVVSRYSGEESNVKKALGDRGGALADDVVFVSPYVTKSRAAYLQEELEEAKHTQGNWNAIAFVIGVFGIFKLMFGYQLKRMRQQARARGAEVEATPATRSAY